MLKLERPLVFFDLETTGLDVTKDRIVSIAVSKYLPEGKVVEGYELINPEIPIPEEAYSVHGISDSDVVGKKTFREIAKGMLRFMTGCDFGGYNVNYDLRLLYYEFKRNDLEFLYGEAKIIDPKALWSMLRPRHLVDAAKFWAGIDEFNAHNAAEDVDATIKVFEEQLKEKELKGLTVAEIHHKCYPDMVDLDHKFKMKNGVIVFNFGKHMGKPAASETGYLKWMMKGEFTGSTRYYVEKLLKGEIK